MKNIPLIPIAAGIGMYLLCRKFFGKDKSHGYQAPSDSGGGGPRGSRGGQPSPGPQVDHGITPVLPLEISVDVPPIVPLGKSEEIPTGKE